MCKESADILVRTANEFSASNLDAILILATYMAEGKSVKIPTTKLVVAVSAIGLLLDYTEITIVNLGDKTVIATNKCDCSSVAKKLQKIKCMLEGISQS
jgi:hypothetical protein